MREHQITINLRPDQFQEVQRLSRAAGSRSIGLFAREKLLNALGLSSASATGRAAGPDLKSATSDIRRLHRELQNFIAESLSTKDHAYNTAAAAQPVNEPNMYLSPAAEDMPSLQTPVIESPVLESGPPTLLPGSSGLYTTHEIGDPLIQEQAQTGDEMEELAERAFAISPRLGAIDEFSDDDLPFSDPLDELLGDMMAAERSLENQESAVAFVEAELSAEALGMDAESRTGAEGGGPDFDQETEEEASEEMGGELAEETEDQTEDEPEHEAGREAKGKGEGEAKDKTEDKVEDEAEDKTKESSQHESLEKTTLDDQVPIQSDSDEDPPSDPPAASTNFPIPPPISGGPPPRRRRT
jgi:hypothetical protein